MVTLERTPPTPRTWTDRRLAEACTLAATGHGVAGMQAAAWRAASLSFMEAQRATNTGDPGRAAELRDSAARVLREAGLRVEHAVTGQVLKDAIEAPVAQLSPAQHKAVILAECTARMLYLRDAAETAAPAYAEAAAIHYGAASCYERAVRAWNAGEVGHATVWQQAAETTLDNHRIAAPWHQAPAPQDVPPTD